MNKYTIYCTEAQTRKALELGAPMEPQTSSTLIDTLCAFCSDGMYVIPTAEQMISWLEEQENIIEICIKRIGTWRYEIYIEPHYHKEEGGYSTRKEATLAAIDAALEYLTNNKK